MSKIKNLSFLPKFSNPRFLFKSTTSKIQFGQKQKWFCTVVQTKTSAKPTCRKSNTFIVPVLTSERINEISAITGISIGLCHISWIKFQTSPSITILDWNAKILPDDFRLQTNESDILKMAYQIKHTLPDSDLYVMETFSMRGRELSARINEIHLSSMLTVLLNGIDKDPDWKDKVIFQKQSVLNNLYGILIASERVSTRLITENILSRLNHSERAISEDKSKDLLSSIQILPKYLDLYKESYLEKKEDLSIVFLLALSFIEVNIFKIQASLAKLKNKSWR